MRKMKRGIVFLLFFGFIFLLFLHPIDSGDFFHHLNSGKYVVERFSLPYKDNLSFTAYGKPWVAYAWGSGVLFYGVYFLFGPVGISFLFALFGALACLFLYLTLTNLKINRYLSFLLTLLAAAITSLRWPTRPEILGPVFIVVLIYLLTRYKRPTWFLPIFFWLCAIFYGASTFLGILILIFFLVSNRLFDKKSLLIATVTFIFSLLNGYGFASFLYIFQIPQIAPHVGEWLPIWATLNPRLPGLVLFYQYRVIVYGFLVLIYLVTLITGFISDRKRFFTFLFFLGISFAVFAPLYTNRFMNVAALLAMPIVGIVVDALSKRTRIILLGLICLLTLTAIYISFKPLSLQVGLGGLFQTKLTQFLKENRVSGNIYAMQEIGAFLSWELPGSKIFVDTRDDLYQPLGIFAELRQLDEGKIDIISLLNKYQADIVVGELGSLGGVYKPLFYSNGWSLVYLTDGYFIILRNDLVEKYLLTSYDSLDPLRIPPAKPGLLKEAEVQLEELLAKEPTSTENKVRMAELKLVLDKSEEAKQIIDSLSFSDYIGLELKGKIYLANGDCDQAFTFLTKADRLSRGQLIFFPKVRLPTTVDRYLADYYLECKDDKTKAKEYLFQLLKDSSSPIDKRNIEQKLDTINE